jgi:hypothetical protein
MPITQTQRVKRLDPFCVFINQELGFFSSLATILNLLQKSSPRSPRFGNKLSSELPRMMVSVNLTSGAGDFEGRTKTGVMGVMGG